MGMTEDEMAEWHHRLDAQEFGWTPGIGDGQGGLACCDSWGGKESATTEQLNWTGLKCSNETALPCQFSFQSILVRWYLDCQHSLLLSLVWPLPIYLDSWTWHSRFLCNIALYSSLYPHYNSVLGADCGSDHELLNAKFRLKLKKVGKTTRPFRYDLNQIPYDYTVKVTNSFKELDLKESAWTTMDGGW